MISKIKLYWAAICVQWQAEETKIGKFLKNKLSWFVGSLAAIGELVNQAEVIAVQQYIDPVVFRIMAGCALASALIGKLTAKYSQPSTDGKA